MDNKLIIKKAMNLLLNGNSAVLKQLTKQYENSKITDIRETGKGIFVDFKVLDTSLKLNLKGVKKDFVFGDVYGEISTEYGDVEFILFVKDGYITMLEGFTYFSDGWSKVTNETVFRYFNGDRDINELDKKWIDKDFESK
ncbi:MULTISPECIES: hypothetical protein [unclassified Breznakia]|uniref:hypothetical protein n=1 Tax=unclassified Breznakia TaxID=2623764 RepID=UPI00240685D9|nr:MULTISPECIES: hypothetical protein [unclassified Breznakia]MDF9838029.1 hypothetical protein [Breznakia sp. PFB2-8]MDF9859407.1 hypothetical protein [Breznakia sp. PH5-24]